MHGRLKVRTTEEQRLLKEKQNQKKLAIYRAGMKQIFSSRKDDSYDSQCLTICAQLLLANPDIYTLWNYRKEVLLIEIKESKANENEDEGVEKLAQFLENELKLTEQCLIENPKSYGSWHHRYWVLEHHPKPNWQNEFDLCTKYLSKDDRNFHCWDYRKLILSKVEVSLEDEIKFSTERLNVNFSNYSSWHYRSTLRKLDESCIESELTLVQNAVFTDPSDSSAWFYLRWVLSNPGISQEKRRELLDAFDQLQELEPDCRWIIMAKCWLTGSLCLTDKNHIDNRIDYYKQLIKLDPKRKGQYKDYLKIAEERNEILGDN